MSDRDVYVQDANGTTLLARQVGWMPTKELADRLGLTPLSDDYLATIEMVAADDGIRPELMNSVVPVYVLEVPDEEGRACGAAPGVPA